MSIYDDIIVSKDAALINLKRQKAEYQITDLSDNIQYTSISLSLSSLAPRSKPGIPNSTTPHFAGN